jgi:hypothetical protein
MGSTDTAAVPRDSASRGWLLLAAALLVLYTAGMIYIEAKYSRFTARHYFTDIKGPVRFFALNTTVSVALQWATAGLFLVAARWCDRADRKRFVFHLSQVVVFGWLGMDDRFHFHESIGRATGIKDPLILLAVGIVELALLVSLGGVPRLPLKMRAMVGLAGASFLGMTAIDWFAPDDGWLRLSSEDLLKVWSCFFLACFAWMWMEREVRGAVEAHRG